MRWKLVTAVAAGIVTLASLGGLMKARASLGDPPDPGSDVVLSTEIGMAKLLLADGDYSGALSHLRKVVESYPDSAEANDARLMTLYIYSEMGDLYTAMVYAQDECLYIADPSSRALVWRRLGEVLYKGGLYQDAARSFENCLAVPCDYLREEHEVQVLRLLHNSYCLMGWWMEALDVSDRLVSICQARGDERDLAKALFRRAKTLLKAGRRDDAMDEFDKLIAEHPRTMAAVWARKWRQMMLDGLV